VPGNRDYYSSNITAEIAYSGHSARWKMPALNYAMKWNVPGTQIPLLHIVFMDTWDLTSASKNASYPAEDPAKGLAALNFLVSSFSNSPYPWRIVVSHYPIYSSGAHGPFNADLVNNLFPTLVSNGVFSYWAGHDHSLQYLTRPITPGYAGGPSTLHMFNFGAGSEGENSIAGATGQTSNIVFQYPRPPVATGGFGTVSLNLTHLTVTFYDQTGTRLVGWTLGAPLKYPISTAPTSTAMPTVVMRTPPSVSAYELRCYSMTGLMLTILLMFQII